MKRETNYDLLRVFSMLAVIMIHVSQNYIGGYTLLFADKEILGGIDAVVSCIYNTLSRFAVPCFIMLTGAFALDSRKTVNYKEFYKNSFIKLGIPTIIFTIIYTLYKILLAFLGGKTGIGAFVDVFVDILKGKPYYHMWYMYMLIGLYALAPIVVRFKNSISFENFEKVAFIFLIVASISRWTKEVTVMWDIGQAFEYLGCFMVGFVLRKKLTKNNTKGICLVLSGFIVLLITAFIQYKFQVSLGIQEQDLKLEIVSPYCPMIVLASVLIFAGFTKLEMKGNKYIEKLSNLSFLIYLIHAGVWHALFSFISVLKEENYMINHLNCVIWVPIFVILVLIVSMVGAAIYNFIFTRTIGREIKKFLLK